MKSYRQVLKELREGRGISQEELANLNIISASQISNYEREKSHLTVEKFLGLLDYFNMPLDIFQQLLGEPIVNFREEIRLVSLARERRSLRELERLKADFKEKQKSIPRYTQLILLIEVYTSIIQGTVIGERGIKDLKNYFDNEQGDDYFRIVLFTNVFFLFEPEYVESKVRRLERKIKLYTRLSKEFNKEVQFYLNLINFYIKHNYFNRAKLTIQTLKIELSGSYNVYEIEKLNFLEGKLLIKSGEVDKGTEIAQKAINRMVEYNWNNKSSTLQKVLEKIISDNN